METLAEQLYAAITELLAHSTTGLLAAVADAKSQIPYDQASPKTRTVFTNLAVNLTRIQEKR